MNTKSDAAVHTETIEPMAVAVDCVVFGLDDEDLKVLLIVRDQAPFEGHWALPGGFVGRDETLEQAARRELEEEAGLKRVYLEQFCAFDAIGRDPRGRVLSVAYYALVNVRDHRVRAATDARRAAWVAVKKAPPLAFDHKTILRLALQRLKEKVRHQPTGFELLPPKFSLSQLRNLYETILERSLDKRNFRRKVLHLGFLDDTGEVETGVSHRAARLYQFNKSKYRRLVQEGVNFEL